MRNPNSLEEVAEIHSLLEDIKTEYNQGIRGILKKNDSNLFRNVHTLPKLEKIQINRGLGLTAQNTNILKKSIEEFRAITGQKPLITKSKNDTTHSRRIAFSYLKQKEAITELFSDIATKVSDRQGGYTRILKLSNRLGDNAQMALIELVDYNEEYTTNKPKKSKSRRTRKKNLDQSTITESNKDNIIEDVTSSEIIDVATSEKVEENIVEKKSSDVKDESNIKTEKEVTDAENKEEKGE